MFVVMVVRTVGSSIVHIVGLEIQIGSQRRQRCAWCGAVIDDMDLARVQVQLNPDGSNPGPPGSWPVGALIEVFDGVMYVVGHNDGDKLPDNCCGMLPAEITGAHRE